MGLNIQHSYTVILTINSKEIQLCVIKICHVDRTKQINLKDNKAKKKQITEKIVRYARNF